MTKILVIEDEPEMRRNILTILKLEPFQGLGAENGRIGLELARREKPALIVCDVLMPELDGYGVLEALRTDPQTVGTPFVFLTAEGEKADLRNGMNLGADDYRSEPVSKADLVETIAARLQRQVEQSRPEFKPNFDSLEPLTTLGLTPHVAEVLLWVAQSKTNPEIGVILDISEPSVKKHLLEILETLGVETRTAAALRALEVLNSPAARPVHPATATRAAEKRQA